MIPKVLESQTVYEGKIFSIKRDKLTRDGRDTFVRETVVSDDAVGIVAVDGQGRILLIRQYRHPVGQPVWEIPAGKMDVKGEKPEETALRELREETDTRAAKIEFLTMFLNSAGWTTEKTYIYLARILRMLRNLSEKMKKPISKRNGSPWRKRRSWWRQEKSMTRKR